MAANLQTEFSNRLYSAKLLYFDTSSDDFFKGSVTYVRFGRILIKKLSSAKVKACFTDACIFRQSGLILGLRQANARRCYFVTTSLIGWV